VWVLVIGTLVNWLGRFVVVYLTLYLTTQGYSPAEAGLAVAGYGVGNIAAAAIGGFLADRIGRRRTIVLSMTTSAGAMLALSQARGLWSVVVWAGAAGLTSEMFRAPSGALIADVVPRDHLVTGFAVNRLAMNLGAAIGPVIGAFIAQRSFFALFVGDALSSLAFAALALALLPADAHPRRVPAGSVFENYRSMLADRRFLAFLGASLLGALIYRQAYTTLSLHVRDAGLPIGVYGWLLALNAVMVILFELPLTTVTRSWRSHRVIAAGLLLVGTGFALNTVASTTGALVASVIVWSAGEIIYAPQASALWVKFAPDDARGQYASAYSFTWALAWVFAGTVGGALFAHDPNALWIACGLAGLAAMALALAGQPRRGRTEPSISLLKELDR